MEGILSSALMMTDRRSGAWAVPAVLGGVLALAVMHVDWRLLVALSLALPLVTWGVLRQSAEISPTAVPTSRAGGSLLLRVPWIAATWTGLLLLPSLRVFSQDAQRYEGQAASGNLSIDNLLMLGASMAALLTVAAALRRGWSGRLPAAVWLYALFVGFGMMSVMWSRLTIYSGGRAIQFFALLGLTAVCAIAADRDPTFFTRVVRRVVALYVPTVLALAAWGLTTPDWWDGRYTWPGSHPNTAASLFMLGVLLVVTVPRHEWRARSSWGLFWYAPAPIFLFFAFQAHGRGFVAAGLGAVAVAWLVQGMRDSRQWALFGAASMMVVAIAVTFFREQIIEFVMREQTADEVAGLGGRVEVWVHALANPVGNEIWGVGLGANQGLVVGDWAPHNAHSAWIDTLQTLGVVGVGLLAAAVLTLLIQAVVNRAPGAISLAIFAAVISVTSSTLSNPTTMSAVLCFAMFGLSARMRATLDPSAVDTGAGPPRPIDLRRAAAAATSPAHPAGAR